MPRRLAKELVAGAFVLVCSAAPAVWAHPFEVTTAQLDWNGTTDAFEVALRISPDQLGAILATFDLKTTEDPTDREASKQIDDALAEFLRRHFRLLASEPPATSNDQCENPSAQLHWVGREEDEGAIWLYFELLVGTGCDPTRFTLHNSLFLEERPRQLNTVRVRIGQRQKAWVLSQERPSAPLATLGDSQAANASPPKPTDQKEKNDARRHL